MSRPVLAKIRHRLRDPNSVENWSLIIALAIIALAYVWRYCP